MGFMDKVKAQAQTIAEKAQEQAKAGQEKLSAMQAKKQSDALLLEIGGIVYAQRVGRADPGGDERIAALVTRLQAFEAEHGQVQTTAADPPTGASGSYIPSSPSSSAGSGSSDIPVASSGTPETSEGGDGSAKEPSPPPASTGGIPTGSYSSDTPS